MTEKLKNAGYTIIERFTVGEQGFALGHSETAPAPYVTWQYRAAAPDHFFWGHYMNSKEAAYADKRRDRIRFETHTAAAHKETRRAGEIRRCNCGNKTAKHIRACASDNGAAYAIR